jgi:hypothetical protein
VEDSNGLDSSIEDEEPETNFFKRVPNQYETDISKILGKDMDKVLNIDSESALQDRSDTNVNQIEIKTEEDLDWMN